MKIKPFNQKLAQLTQLLNDGNYHDGNVLGKTLNITRSAVWKMIKKLEQYDIAIDAIQSNGYALKEPLILLEPNEIKKSLSHEHNIELTVLESTDSTNAYFKTQPKIKTITKTIKCCLSEQQTQGRGRLNRVWHSPFGKNIYLSCYYPFQKDISELAGLSLVVGLSTLAALRSLGLTHDICTKWPNDLLCGNKKMAGILIDIQAESHGVSDVTIGIGLNVNMLSAEQTWTSLAEETGHLWDRNHVAAVLLEHLLTYMRRFEQQGFAVFIDEWMASDSLMKKTVTLNHANNFITGEVIGINPQGHLLLRLSDGHVHAFSSGDATLVKK